jgi:putative oxidoreductase
MFGRKKSNKATGNGQDVAALVLRTALGTMLFAHGYNKVSGPGGLEGTTGWFKSLGLEPANVHAKLAAGTEMAAGAGLVAGAANPLPAAATVGLMAVAARTDHRGKGYFVFKGGWEYCAVVGAAAVSLAALGNGRYSLDNLVGRKSTGGVKPALIAAGLGAANAALLLKLCYKPEKKADETIAA